MLVHFESAIFIYAGRIWLLVSLSLDLLSPFVLVLTALWIGRVFLLFKLLVFVLVAPWLHQQSSFTLVVSDCSRIFTDLYRCSCLCLLHFESAGCSFAIYAARLCACSTLTASAIFIYAGRIWLLLCLSDIYLADISIAVCPCACRTFDSKISFSLFIFVRVAHLWLHQQSWLSRCIWCQIFGIIYARCSHLIDLCPCAVHFYM